MAPVTAFRTLFDRFVALGIRRNAMLAAAQAIVGAGALFVCYRLVIVFHGLEKIGLWSVLLAVINIVRLFDPSGNHVLSRNVARSHKEGDGQGITEYIDSLTIFLLAAYIVLPLLAYFPIAFFMPRIFESENLPEALILLPWMLGSLFVNVIGLALAGAIDGLQRADLRGYAMIASQAIFILFAAVLIPPFGLLGFVWAQIVQFFALAIMARMLLRREVRELGWLPRRFRLHRLKEILSYGVKVQMTGWAGFLGDPLARLLLNRYGGLAPTAVYEIASKVVVQVRMVIAAGAIPLIPMFAAGESDGREKQVGQIRQINGFLIKLISASVVLICLSSPLVAYIMLGKPTELFAVFTGLLMFGWSTNMMSMVLYLYGHGLGFLKWNIIGNMSVAVGTIVFAFFFTPLFGAGAIVGGFALGLILSSAIIIVGNAHVIGAPVARLFPLDMILRWWVPAMAFAVAATYAMTLLV